MQCCHVVHSLSIEPGDYDAVNTTVRFRSGTTCGGQGSQRCIAIEISSMDGFELDETFLLSADSPDPDVTIINNITIIILNSDGR